MAYRNGYRSYDSCNFAVKPLTTSQVIANDFSCKLNFKQEDHPEHFIYVNPGIPLASQVQSHDRTIIHSFLVEENSGFCSIILRSGLWVFCVSFLNVRFLAKRKWFFQFGYSVLRFPFLQPWSFTNWFGALTTETHYKVFSMLVTNTEYRYFSSFINCVACLMFCEQTSVTCAISSAINEPFLEDILHLAINYIT